MNMAGQPVTKFRAGAVSCALWENKANVNGRNITIVKATVERRYKDNDGTWKSTGSYGRGDIPLVVFCLQKAFGYMLEERSLGDDES